MLLAAVALKLDPLIVTTVPIGPEVGEKELIVGWPKMQFEKKQPKK
jgi:hypothetical protein